MRRVLVATAAFVTMFVFANSPLAAEEIEIKISPNVINIASAATLVTVHTDIPYSFVVGETVTLNGIEIKWWKSDDRGYFVAKFLARDVKDLLVDEDDHDKKETVTLRLWGETFDGGSFSGEDEVVVINVKAKKRK